MSDKIFPLTDEQRLMVEKNLPLISFCLGGPKRWAVKDAAVTYDDLWQIGTLGLIIAAKRYDPSRGKFAAFACPHIVGAILRYLKLLRAQKRLANRNPVRLDRPIFMGDADSATIGDMLPGDQDTAQEALERISSTNVFAHLEAELSPYAKSLLALRLDGASQQEIAKRMGIQQKDVKKYLTVVTLRVKQLVAECMKEVP